MHGSYWRYTQFGEAQAATYLSSVYIGGAIIVNNSVVNISQSMFEDNGADLGGAILAEQRCTIHLSKY